MYKEVELTPLKKENKKMANHFCFAIFLSIVILFFTTVDCFAVTAYDLINLINGMRSSNGLGALSVDSALMACAQSTAETMAASNMTWHIGNVAGGRLLVRGEPSAVRPCGGGGFFRPRPPGASYQL